MYIKGWESMDLLRNLLKRLECEGSVCIACRRRVEKERLSGDGVCICPKCYEKLMKTRASDYYDTKGEIGRLFAPFRYDGIIKRLIHDLKFSNSSSYAKPLADLLYEALPPYYDLSGFDMIVPVPLSGKRLDERKYNQAELIALELARLLGVEMADDVLFRVRDTKRQMSLTRNQRLLNVKCAFLASEAVSGKSILLVDDIYTVGATANECALTLKGKGAAKIDAVVLCTNFKPSGQEERKPTIPAIKRKKIPIKG